MESEWRTPPDYSETYETMRGVAILEAELEMLDLEIEQVENDTKREKPRDTVARFDATKDLLRLRAEKRATLRLLKADQDFNNFRLGMFKTMSYNNRG